MSSSPSARSSKRFSFNGPRPLHLVDTASNTIDPPKQVSPTNRSRTNPRRQSSISYLPRDRASDGDATIQSPLSSPRYSSTRSNSVLVRPTSLPIPRDRKSGAFEVKGPPRTLAEKHSELLHFIAQKESKCLELRSQLSMHEAELLELKRKWERIISRGFETSNSSLQSQGSGAMLEGIREGVQGVSRFLAAGLAISELSPPSTPTTPQPDRRRTHSASQSNSSISTNTTKSTRFSQSSTSSIGEEPPQLKEEGKDDPILSTEDETVPVLIVRDTGATPTMSPNPDFVRKQQQHQERHKQTTALFLSSTHSSFETEPDCFPPSSMNESMKIHRRKSRDNSDSLNLFSPTDSASSYHSASPSVDLKQEASSAKRATMNGSAFPPVSSIPGLGSLAVAATSPPVVSAWVGTVGKKWEELQRGSTFSKSQKRASLLLSDMSQSIASAISISSPPLFSSASTSTSTSPSYFSPLSASPIIASTTSSSLLDNDDNDHDFICSSVMKPDLKLKPTPIMQPLGSSPRPNIGTKAAGMHTNASDEDEEWNW
ncbi:hypothetical protein L208DRAFT_149624 [Tricholoma matsutake]|nr:hypothetical protein L208DRAFT_149624 [Tricholoma matsutake 945]